MSDDSFDVVVIGAGLGGLGAAAHLARSGYRVLVAEQRANPGGYATSFERGRFRFDASLHLMDAVGPGEPNHALLDALGIGGLELVRPPFLRRERWPEHDVRVPSGREAYLEAMGRLFPREIGGLGRLVDLARRVHADSLSERLSERVDPLGPLARATAGAVVDAHIRDGRLRAMLDLFCSGWVGLPLDEASALQLLVAWYSYHGHGGWVPVGGSGRLSQALVDVVRESGGQVALGVAATRIVTRRRRVRAVDFADGRAVETSAVVCNASAPTTFGSLVDPAEVDARLRARLASMKTSTSCLKIWLGLSAADAVPTEDYDTYLCASYAPAPRIVSVLARHRLLAEPPTVAITTLVDVGSDVRPDDADALVGEVESHLLPGLREHVEERTVATPHTLEGLTGNPGGSMYGWSAIPEQCGARRMSPETPVAGLWLAGAWTRPGAGFTSALRSGLTAAKRLMRSRDGVS